MWILLWQNLHTRSSFAYIYLILSIFSVYSMFFLTQEIFIDTKTVHKLMYLMNRSSFVQIRLRLFSRGLFSFCFLLRDCKVTSWLEWAGHAISYSWSVGEPCERRYGFLVTNQCRLNVSVKCRSSSPKGSVRLTRYLPYIQEFFVIAILVCSYIYRILNIELALTNIFDLKKTSPTVRKFSFEWMACL